MSSAFTITLIKNALPIYFTSKIFSLMSKSITTLANLLHKFNSQTISRSLEYVSRIDLESLENRTAQTTQLQADIKGTKKYHTQIAYHQSQSAYHPK